MTVQLGREKAHKADLALRRALARRFKDDHQTADSSRPFVESFLKLGFEHLVSFNFDSVLLPKGVRPKRERSRTAWAKLSAKSAQATVWYPHGHASIPSSIVLGSRAYGTRIGVFQAAFNRQAMLAKKGVRDITNVVSVFMQRPLLFLGLSLSREEWTLWWLLAQRARYLKGRKSCPSFAVVRSPSKKDSKEMAAFDTLQRAADVVDLNLLVVKEHNEGWRHLQQALRWTPAPPVSRGQPED